jgi:hypothetical protein
MHDAGVKTHVASVSCIGCRIVRGTIVDCPAVHFMGLGWPFPDGTDTVITDGGPRQASRAGRELAHQQGRAANGHHSIAQRLRGIACNYELRL